MTTLQQVFTIGLCAIATMLTRFAPFLLFAGRKTPKYIQYLGKALPGAIFGMLVVYCLKGVSLGAVSDWLPSAIACVVTVGLYVWKRNTLVSIVAGTVCYMLLVQLVF